MGFAVVTGVGVVGAGESLPDGVAEDDRLFSPLSVSSARSLAAEAPTRLLALAHSASTSATMSPQPVSESKLRMDEMSPSSVLSLSEVGSAAEALGFSWDVPPLAPTAVVAAAFSSAAGFGVPGLGLLGCDAGACDCTVDPSRSRSPSALGAGRGVSVRCSLMISTLLEREAVSGGPVPSSVSSASSSRRRQRMLPNRLLRPLRCRPPRCASVCTCRSPSTPPPPAPAPPPRPRLFRNNDRKFRDLADVREEMEGLVGEESTFGSSAEGWSFWATWSAPPPSCWVWGCCVEAAGSDTVAASGASCIAVVLSDSLSRVLLRGSGDLGAPSPLPRLVKMLATLLAGLPLPNSLKAFLILPAA